jgi:hypothetical protein
MPPGIFTPNRPNRLMMPTENLATGTVGIFSAPLP